MIPKISVIIPIYNAEYFLRRCIDSILAQTFSDFEILLIDDGSSDASGKICDEYAAKDNRVRAFHKKNSGPSAARNEGLDNATGQYVFFVDADDYLSESHLYNYSLWMENYDIVYQGYRLFDEESNATLERKAIDKEGVGVRQTMDVLCEIFVYGGLFGPTWSKIFRRSYIEEHGMRFDENLRIREDEIFTFEYCKHVKSIKSLETFTYNYQKTPSSLMRQGYYAPDILEKACICSYSIACKLPLTDQFKKTIDLYYTDTLTWCGKLCYNPYHLATKEIRKKILGSLFTAYKQMPSAKSMKFLKYNIFITDTFHLFVFYLKFIARILIRR